MASETPEPFCIPSLGPGISESLELIWNWYQQGRNTEEIGRDGFRLYSGDPLAAIHRQLNEYLIQIKNACGQWGIGSINPKEFPIGAFLLALPEEKKLMGLRAIAVRILFHRRREEQRLSDMHRESSWADQIRLVGRLMNAVSGGDRQVNPEQFSSLASRLIGTGLPYTEADLSSFIDIVAGQKPDSYFPSLSNEIILRTVEQYAARNTLSSVLQKHLLLWWDKLQSGSTSSPGRKLLTRINALIGPADNPGIVAGDAWSDVALEDLKKMPAAAQAHWCKLLQHCQKAETPKPTQKWTKAAKPMLEAIGRENFKEHILRWFDLVALPRPGVREEPGEHSPDRALLIADINSVILKGLVWLCADWKDTDIIRGLSRLTEVCFKKVRNLGPRCPRVGNACLYSLKTTSTEEAVSELSRLNQTVKQPSARKLIGKSLDGVAEATGQTREDLEESTIPTYGLDMEGHCKEVFGDFTAEFSILGEDAFQMLWRKADGKLQKSVPAEVKEKYAKELKAFKRTLQDIEKMLPAQRRRIERLLMSEREWDLETWRKRYLNHPLMADLARRLIWNFKLGDRSIPGAWLDGKLVDVDAKLIDWLAPETRVRLWHPVGFPVETVAAWREWLQTHRVCQPFKQAHREIYILTDAEQQTATYSNRFAAHIIRQHQFAALAKDRGWSYLLQGAFDSHNVPTLLLPQWNLAVEFWVDSPGGHEGTSQMGIFLYLSTDQVRFVRDGEALSLTEIPALVFTEVMRDVDLFVGVASIGSDPAWQDQGEIPGGAVYWNNFSFGDLNASAKTRKEVLEKLLPKLKIAGQCSLNEKFLVVKGSLRTYKIHLGSGNIQMEPNNQYLCIVPNRGAGAKSDDKLFLPFEGDRTLSVILSKAFLLADDTKIKDPSIVSQIKR
jgi:Domain of unknown function (DUF4132)